MDVTLKFSDDGSMCFSVFTVNSLKAPVSEFTIHNCADGNKVRRMDSGYCGFVNQLSQPPKFTSLSLAEDDFPPVKVRPLVVISETLVDYNPLIVGFFNKSGPKKK